MIKKAQIKFISITMAIVFITFAAIYTGLAVIMRSDLNKIAWQTLSDTLSGFTRANRFLGETGEKDEGFHQLIQANGIIYELRPDGEAECYYDHSFYTEETVKDISENILDSEFKPQTVYKYKTVYFMQSLSEGKRYIVATDLSNSLSALSENLIAAFLILFIIFALLFVLVWALSYKVFAPIKTAIEKQKTFISDASHELKTPIAVISANADVLAGNGPSEWIDNIKSQTARMDALVKDMLTLAKTDEAQTAPSVEKFNVSKEAERFTLPFDALAFENGKTLNCDIEKDLYITGDRTGFEKIGTVLIDNAIKYSSENGTVNVFLKRKNDKILLTVYNTGSEIPEEDSQRIFERFYRGDASRSRETGGSGLGLAIAKALADKNKWKLSAHSVKGKSMEITLSLNA